ncbi:MAG: hypothetical protein HY899_00815 [Deltaproteobacteria bacterium]|nr:hypothetical protein [Deltaproteobacteria bacterium]
MRSTKRRLSSLLCLLLVAAPACRAQSDQALDCYRSKLAAVRWGTARLLRCAAAPSTADRTARCRERAELRIAAMLEAAEVAAAAEGFVCPAGAESLGLDGAATWPMDVFEETIAGDLAVAPRCARTRARAVAGYASTYVQCRAVSDQEDSSDAAACTERERRSFERAWSEGAAEGCRGDIAPDDVAARIESEVEADAARLRVRCGDGRREGFEACDDGGVRDADGCSATCLSETCARVDAEVHCIACPADSEPDYAAARGRCAAGFGGEPGSCQDIDECLSGEASCPQGRACVNVPGSFSCAIPCTEQAFEEAITSCGAPSGHITFDCRDTVIPIAHASGTRPRRVDCDGLVIDGLDRNISFEMDPLCWRIPVEASQCAAGLEDDGTCACPDVDSGTTFLLLAGDGDVVRNIAVTGFFDGIRAQGVGGVVENVRFGRICDDAFGSVGAGVANVFRNLEVRDGCDKCSQNSGSLATTDTDPRVREHYNAIFSNIDFIGCRTPLRMAQGGRFRVEDARMGPGADGSFACDGPRFSGAAPGGLVVEMRRSTVTSCRRGVRFGRYAAGILDGNSIQACALRGVWAGGNARVSLSANDVRANGGKGSSEYGFGGVAASGDARVDLGGAGLDIDGVTVVSPGANSICDNYEPGGARRDVDNVSTGVVAAEDNWWCTKESPSLRVNGPVDVMPYLERAP